MKFLDSGLSLNAMIFFRELRHALEHHVMEIELPRRSTQKANRKFIGIFRPNPAFVFDMSHCDCFAHFQVNTRTAYITGVRDDNRKRSGTLARRRDGWRIGGIAQVCPINIGANVFATNNAAGLSLERDHE